MRLSDKEFKPYIRELLRRGWRMERPGKHPKLISPWGDVVPFSLSPF
jgi:hypothetical protein